MALLKLIPWILTVTSRILIVFFAELAGYRSDGICRFLVGICFQIAVFWSYWLSCAVCKWPKPS
jgi:hypothetical protein